MEVDAVGARGAEVVYNCANPKYTEWAEKVATPWADFEYAGRAKMAAAGHEVYKLTPEQLKAWKDATAPGEAQWAESVKKVGQDPKKVMDSLKANLVKYKAAL